MPRPTLHAVILAGGPGVRFWPWSTPRTPKHALPLLPDGGTLFGATVRRLRLLVPPSRLWLVTTAAQAGTLRRLAPTLRPDRVIVEPEARDTAPAVGVAAKRILAADPDGMMLVCPADHAISPDVLFARQARAAARLAAGGRLVTFGIRPTRPATGYGYLEVGRGSRVEAFREKPSPGKARAYLRSGRFLWNAGIFCWRADVFLRALSEHAPELARRLDSEVPLKRLYPTLPRISVDYAVMEKAADVAFVRAAFRWSDWGTWTAWEETLKPDARGNRVFGNARVERCRDTTAVGADPRRPLVVTGAEGHLVVQAPAGLLVCRRDQADDLKRLLA